MTSPPPAGSLRIVALLGTSRPGNLTRRVLEVVLAALRAHPGTEVMLLDPAELSLPFPGQPGSYPDVARLLSSIREAHGVVMATPEYQGTYTAILKLVIENLGYPSVLAGKPVALVGVASGRFGAGKAIEHLRGVCGHLGAIALPSAICVAQVQRVLDADGRCTDPHLERLAGELARSLLLLSGALAGLGAPAAAR